MPPHGERGPGGREICRKCRSQRQLGAEQLAAQASRGVRNEVSAVHLDQGDLAEAWSEGGREYATVAMRFSMVDVTRDAAGRIVEGDPNVRTQATELWTFLRAPGGRWILSAIQQAR